MARKPEAQYTSDIKRKLGAGVYALKMCLPYTAGVADTWYDGPARDIWVEYKFLNPIPPTINLVAEKNPVLTKLQQDFLRERHRNGRSVAVIVGSKQGGVIFPGLTWETPISRDEFLIRAKGKQDVADYLTNYVSGFDSNFANEKSKEKSGVKTRKHREAVAIDASTAHDLSSLHRTRER